MARQAGPGARIDREPPQPLYTAPRTRAALLAAKRASAPVTRPPPDRRRRDPAAACAPPRRAPDGEHAARTRRAPLVQPPPPPRRRQRRGQFRPSNAPATGETRGRSARPGPPRHAPAAPVAHRVTGVPHAP